MAIDFEAELGVVTWQIVSYVSALRHARSFFVHLKI